MDQVGPKVAKACKAHVGVADGRRAVLIDVRRSGSDDGEAVICRCDTCCLDGPITHIIDERTLATTVIAQQKYERKQRCLVATFFQRPSQTVIDGLKIALQLVTTLQDAALTVQFYSTAVSSV